MAHATRIDYIIVYGENGTEKEYKVRNVNLLPRIGDSIFLKATNQVYQVTKVVHEISKYSALASGNIVVLKVYVGNDKVQVSR